MQLSASDLVCTTPQCTTGEAQISAMDSVFKSAPANVQAQFQDDHDAVMSSFNALYSWYTNYIPFNSDCCTIADLGTQADTVRCNIQAAMGQPCTSTPQSGMSLTTILVLAGAGYLALVYLAAGHR